MYLGIKTPTHTTNKSPDAPVRTSPPNRPVLQYMLFISGSIRHVRGIRYNGTRTLHLSSSHPHPTTQLFSMNVAHFSPTQALYRWIKRHRWWIKDWFYFLTRGKMRWIIEPRSHKSHQAFTSSGSADPTRNGHFRHDEDFTSGSFSADQCHHLRRWSTESAHEPSAAETFFPR